MYLDFSNLQIGLMVLIFIWVAFVRSGIGFGGIALSMPLMLLVHGEPLFWLPIFGAHVLFFSVVTLRTRIRDVDWEYLKRAGPYIFPAALVGIVGLLSLPNTYLVFFIYGFTIFYAVTWVANLKISSKEGWLDKFMLMFGGYIVGGAMPGMPLVSSVFARHVPMEKLRNTLFLLTFTITSVRMSSFVAAGIDMHFVFALALLPTAWIGHQLGMLAHDYVLRNREVFRRVIGGVLMLISTIGLIKLFWF